MKFTVYLTVLSLILISVPFSLAQSTSSYEVDMFVSDGKKNKQTDAVLMIKNNSFQIIPDKDKYKSQAKEIGFSNVNVADYSHSEKPLLSTGGAITSVILLGVFAIPFFFMKKKQHWLSVRTENDFAVMKLKNDNFRQIIAEFDTKKIAVKTVDESNAADLDKESKERKPEQNQQQKTGNEASAGEPVKDN